MVGTMPLGDIEPGCVQSRCLAKATWWPCACQPLPDQFIGVMSLDFFGVSDDDDEPSPGPAPQISCEPLDVAPAPLDVAPAPLDVAPAPLDVAPAPLDVAPSQSVFRQPACQPIDTPTALCSDWTLQEAIAVLSDPQTQEQDIWRAADAVERKLCQCDDDDNQQHMCKLLAGLYERVVGGGLTQPRAALQVLALFGAAPSGVCVGIKKRPRDSSRGVALVLGWGGSTLQQLETRADVYYELGFTVIYCTGPLSAVLSDALINRISTSLYPQLPVLVRRGLVVHVCSNTGMYLWPKIMAAWEAGAMGQGMPPLKAVLRGIIHECNPDARDAQEQTRLTAEQAQLTQLVAQGEQMAFLFLKGVLQSVKTMINAETAVNDVEKLCRGFRTVGHACPKLDAAHAVAFELDRQLALPVPRLFVYSGADNLIQAEATELYIDELEARFGQTCTRLRIEWAPHMMIPKLDTETFCNAVVAFLIESMHLPPQPLQHLRTIIKLWE